MTYDAAELHEDTDRDTIEKWLCACEDVVVVGTFGGAEFSEREVELVESLRRTVDRRPDSEKPLTPKQLLLLRKLYDKT